MFMKLGMYIIPTLHVSIFLDNNLNITGISKPITMELDVCIIPPGVISREFLINLSPQKYQHCSLSNCWGNNLNIAWMAELIVMKIGTYIMPPEDMSTAYFINPFLQ
jgi:hypothetical protein